MNRNNNDEIVFLFNYPIKNIESKNGILMSESDRDNFKVKLAEKSELLWL